MSAERLAELTKGEATGADYMYYHGMFTRVEEYAEDGRTYYKQGGEGEKGYAPIEAGDDPAKLAEEGKLFVLDNETYYEPLKGNDAVSATPVEDLYVEIPAGYIMLEDADDYAWASGGNYYEKVEAGARLEGGHKYYFLNAGGVFQGLNNYYATWASNNGRDLYELNDSGEYVAVTDTAAIKESEVYYVRDEKPTEPEEPSGDGTGDGSDESGSEQEPEYVYTSVLKLAEKEFAGKQLYEATTTYSGTKLTLYYYNYNATNASGMMTQYRGTYPAAPGGEAAFVDYDNTGRSTGGARLYVSYSEAVRRSGAAVVNSRFGITADEANTVRYAKDANGGHKAYSVFGNYQTLLALDLGALLGGEKNEEVANDPTHEHTYQDNVCTGCGAVDALGVIVGGLQSAGLKTVELGGTLSLDLTFSDVLNWTRQMTRLMEVDGRDDNYFQMLLASLAQNSAEFVSMIGLDVDLALQLNVEGLIGMLPELLSMPEGATPDVASLLPAILAGAKIYLEVAIDTNFYGESIVDAEPIKLWVDVTDDLYLNIYITAPDLGRVVGLAEYSDPTDASTVNTAIGDFFAQGVKIENLINLGDLLSGAGGGSSEAVTAAEGGSGIIVDIGQASTGLLSEDIWGVLDLILGQVLFARDMVSVGITENLIAELIAVLVPEFDDEDLVLLPTFTVTDGDDTSGINLNVGGGSLGLTVNLGVKGGFDDFTAIEDLDTELFERLIGAEGNNTYGIDSFDTYLRSVAYMTENADGTFSPVRGEKGQVTTAQATAQNAAIVLSTEEYALAVYASPEEAWLGDRYEIVDFDADGNPVFGSWVRDENGALETEGEAVEGEDNHTYRYTLEPVADEIAYKNAFVGSPNGAYGILPEEHQDYQGMLGGQVSEGDYVTYGAGTYMLVSRIERLTGEAYTGARYSFDEDSVVGEYALLGDVTIALSLGDLGLLVNQPFSAPETFTYYDMDEGSEVTKHYTEMTAVNEASLRLSTAIDVGFWGNTGANINLGALADMLFGLDAIKGALGGATLVGSDLDINITGDMGSDEYPYFTVKLDAYLDMATYTMQAALEVYRNNADGTEGDKLIAVYLVDDTLYADLSALLGEGVRVAITSLGIEELLATELGGLLGTDGTGQAEAFTASIGDTAGLTLHDYAYLAVLINPGYFSIQLTMAVVDAIIAKVAEDNPDLGLDMELPDIGDIQIESEGKDGNLLSLNLKMSEDFGASLDINHLYIGTEPVFSIEEIGEKFKTEGEGAYKPIYDVVTGLNDEFTISASASATISMTSEGLTPESDKYDESLAGWVIELLTGLLGSNSFFVSAFDPKTDAEYNKYQGPVYVAKTDDNGAVTYEQIGTAYNASLYTDMNGELKQYRELGEQQFYRTTMIEATFAAGEVNLTIDLEADLNIGALMAYGIGGILLSDLRLSVGMGSPFNSTILEVYYLGSSRLSNAKSGTIYELTTAVEAGKLAAFNDAIFIDASGLGLGKIKFQGIAGLLGANIGEIYDPVEEAATAADPEEETSEEETATGGAAYSVSLGIDLAENYVGLNIDRSLIQMVFGLLTPTLESAGIGGLPDVQSLGLGLTFGDRGISSIALDAVVDGAGTGLHLTLGDFNIALENQLDTDNLVNMVKTQFAGVTYSGTAGVKTLLQSLIDGIDPNLSINVDRRAYSVVLDTSGDTYFGVGRDLKSVRTTTNSSLSIVSSYGYQQAGGNGMEQLGGLTTLNDYAIRLDLAANHPDASQDKALTAKVYFGNNNLMIADVDVGMGWASGLADLLKVFNWINLGTLIGGGQLFPSFAYGDDRDAATWQPGDPVATTASEGGAGVAADDTVLYGNGLKTNGDGSIVTDNDTLDKNAFTTRGSAATNVNGPYKWAISDDGTRTRMRTTS